MWRVRMVLGRLRGDEHLSISKKKATALSFEEPRRWHILTRWCGGERADGATAHHRHGAMDDSEGPFELEKGNLRHGGGRKAPAPVHDGRPALAQDDERGLQQRPAHLQRWGGASRGEVASCDIGCASAPLRRNSLQLCPQQRRPARCNWAPTPQPHPATVTVECRFIGRPRRRRCPARTSWNETRGVAVCSTASWSCRICSDIPTPFFLLPGRRPYRLRWGCCHPLGRLGKECGVLT